MCIYTYLTNVCYLEKQKDHKVVWVAIPYTVPPTDYRFKLDNIKVNTIDLIIAK